MSATCHRTERRRKIRECFRCILFAAIIGGIVLLQWSPAVLDPSETDSVQPQLTAAAPHCHGGTATQRDADPMLKAKLRVDTDADLVAPAPDPFAARTASRRYDDSHQTLDIGPSLQARHVRIQV